MPTQLLSIFEHEFEIKNSMGLLDIEIGMWLIFEQISLANI